MRMKEIKNKGLWGIEKPPQILSTQTEYGKDVEEGHILKRRKEASMQRTLRLAACRRKGRAVERQGKGFTP